MTTIAQLNTELRTLLTPSHAEEAATLARNLIIDTLDMTLTEYLMQSDKAIDPHTADDLRKKAMRLANNEPLQYVTGKAYFASRTFEVNPHTLIPRPETEQLTDLICNDNKDSQAPQKILDIGTGSGCIAITLSLEMPLSKVHAIDISHGALQTASTNAQRHQANVTFAQCDILHQVPEGTPYDIVVSNPPYVCHSEKAEMSANVLNYEPHTALFVPDDDPLLFYRRIATLCSQDGLLKEGGTLYFEINEAYAQQTVEMLQALHFTQCSIHHDIYGKPRMVRALLKKS